MRAPKYVNHFTYIDIIRTMKFKDVIDGKSVASKMRYELSQTSDKFPTNRAFEFLQILHDHNFPEKVNQLILKEIKEEFIADEYYQYYIPARYSLFATVVVEHLMRCIQNELTKISNYKYGASGTNAYPIFTILEDKLFVNFELTFSFKSLQDFPLVWVKKPICRRCGELLIKTEDAFAAKFYIESTLTQLKEDGEIYEIIRSPGKYICSTCFKNTFTKNPKLIKVEYKERYLKMEQYESIVSRVIEMDKILTEEVIAVQDMDTIVEKFEDEINTLLRGLKRIYFDGGHIALYQSDANRISGTWASIKKRFYLRMKDQDIIDRTVSTLIIE